MQQDRFFFLFSVFFFLGTKDFSPKDKDEELRRSIAETNAKSKNSRASMTQTAKDLYFSMYLRDCEMTSCYIQGMITSERLKTWQCRRVVRVENRVSRNRQHAYKVSNANIILPFVFLSLRRNEPRACIESASGRLRSPIQLPGNQTNVIVRTSSQCNS